MPALRFNGGAATASTDWVRPADWLTMPLVDSTMQKFAGLLAIFDHDSNFIAFTATGNFTVDWGDGSATENINFGVTAQHKYTYSAISAGTLSTRGYKQVIVTVVPQSGQNLTSMDLNKRHSAASAQIQRVGWLDISYSGLSTATTGLTVGGATTLVTAAMLERAVVFNTTSRTVFASMFNSCGSLQSVPLFNTASGTNFSFMFNSCVSLQSIPLFNTAAGTNFSSMFNSCIGLQSVPLFNTAAGTNFSSMFNACNTLQSLPALNMAVASSAASMSTVFGTAVSLARSLITPPPYSHSYLNCNLSATALNEIYTNLPTVVGQTLTVTGNYGAAGSNTLIATAKGWTVTS